MADSASENGSTPIIAACNAVTFASLRLLLAVGGAQGWGRLGERGGGGCVVGGGEWEKQPLGLTPVCRHREYQRY